jgi:DNA-binding NarL/FixJ family response regulator
MADLDSAVFVAGQTEYEVLLLLNETGDVRPDAIRKFRTARPQIAVLIVTPRTGPEWVQRLMGGGAGGVVLCDDSASEWADAIRTLARGEMFVSRSMVSDVVEHVLRAGPAARTGVESLTDRELAVFELIGSGLKTNEIARRLHLSVKTVESHREKIKHRLGVPDAAALNRYACSWSEKHLNVGPCDGASGHWNSEITTWSMSPGQVVQPGSTSGGCVA